MTASKLKDERIRKDILDDNKELKNQLKHSMFGCCNCLWYGCECKNQEKARFTYYKGHLSCDSYNYYD